MPPHFAQAAIAQLGERQTEDLKVPGSIPGLGMACAPSPIPQDPSAEEAQALSKDYLQGPRLPVGGGVLEFRQAPLHAPSLVPFAPRSLRAWREQLTGARPACGEGSGMVL